MAEDPFSIVENYGEQEGFSCGYCKSSNTNFCFGIGASILSVHDYQTLIDRGWRRCGSYCYKPNLDKICCLMYTIKCEALEFKISKSQKKLLKRMAKFLKNELPKDDVRGTGEGDYRDNIGIEDIPNQNKNFYKVQQNTPELNIKHFAGEINKKLLPNISEKEKETRIMDVQTIASGSKPVNSRQRHEPGATPQSLQSVDIKNGRPLWMKAKTFRKLRKQRKLLAQGKTQEEINAMFDARKQKNHVETLEKLFDEVCNGTDRLKLKLVRTTPITPEYLNQSYEVYRKYQMAIHGVPAEKLTEGQYVNFLVNSPLQIKLLRTMSDEFVNTVEVSANVYKKYQMAVHGDPPEELDITSFYKFMVKSPLQPWTPKNGPPSGYGSFHEQYWLDNELIAVGVIDILPACISSVYFFYDPKYSHLSLGTFSCLREVYLTRQLNKIAPDLKYYYTGFYIHTCPKMRYKTRMRPAKLLCPETYKWFDIGPCLQKLDKQKYCRFNDDLDAIDEDGIIDVNEVMILYSEVGMPYEWYKKEKKVTQEEENQIKMYARMVGMKFAQRVLLYQS